MQFWCGPPVCFLLGLRYVAVVCEVSSKFLLVKYFYLYKTQE